jgi:polysaccharide export outer membrane protein
MSKSRRPLNVFLPLLLAAAGLAWQEAPAPVPAPASPEEVRSTYLLGPEDQITIRAMDAEEISDRPVRIDMNGYVRLPLVGRVRAAGLTVEQLEAELAARLKTYVQQPEVAVTITEFRSQPVSVIGAVKNPGVHQLQGRKTLVEMLSLAGGLSAEAGHSVKITRRREWGPIPLRGAAADASGQFSVAEVSLKSIMEARNPEENVLIRPHDVISVPRAEMVYVIGQVQRAGGFVLNERETISVLQALSLAGGLGHAASPQKSRILRHSAGGSGRLEIAVDLKKILAGKGSDIPLAPEDILFIPASTPKRAAIRAAEAAVQVGTGIAIWRR